MCIRNDAAHTSERRINTVISTDYELRKGCAELWEVPAVRVHGAVGELRSGDENCARTVPRNGRISIFPWRCEETMNECMFAATKRVLSETFRG